MKPMVLGLLLATLSVSAAERVVEPVMERGTIERLAASGSLDSQIRSLARSARDPFWIGFAAPAVEGERVMCCYESIRHAKAKECGSCDLEKDTSFSMNTGDSGSGQLEGDDTFLVLARIADGRVTKLRALSPECAVDPGRLTLRWLQGVAPEAGLAWLGSLAEADGESEDGPWEEAVMALALYRGEEAGRLLMSFMEKGHPARLREQAAFWVGSLRGREGLESLRRALKEDDSTEFRKKVVFALTQVDAPEAIDALVQAARSDRDSDVRGEALFWLAQQAGEKIASRKAAGALDEAIENDPDTDVKKKAVFALSQMPAEEGIPRLIEIARTHRNVQIRREAMFWLGQSGDPRALAFIEQVLNG